MKNLRFPSFSWGRLFAVPVMFFALRLAGTAHAQISPGSVDGAFTVGSDATGSNGIFAVAQQSGGKVLIGGTYGSIEGQQSSPFTRLNADGSLDNTFKRPVIESYDTRTDDIITQTDSSYVPVVRVVQVQPDGKVFVGGNFYFVNGVAGYGGLIRLNADGSLDTTFSAPRFNGTVLSVLALEDGKFAVGGEFDHVGSKAKNCLARLKADGKLDGDFDAGTFFIQGTQGAAIVPGVYGLAAQADGKLVVGGLFTQIAGKLQPGLARLKKDGSLDDSFQAGPGHDPLGIAADGGNQVFSIVPQTDGKLLIGAQVLGSVPNTTKNSVFRLNTDGSLDGSFNAGGAGTDGSVYAVLLENDGKILIGGNFAGYNGVSRRGFARLLSNGALDGSFQTGTGANGAVFAFFQQDDGKLLLGGYFRLINQVVRIFVARVNTSTVSSPGVNVSIRATSPRAVPGTPATKGIFTVERSGGNLTVPLPVYYNLTGSAQAGVDYNALTGIVTIPANSTTARIKVKPRADSEPPLRRKVVAHLSLSHAAGGGSLNGGYGISGSGRAVVKIVNTPVVLP